MWFDCEPNSTRLLQMLNEHISPGLVGGYQRTRCKTNIWCRLNIRFHCVDYANYKEVNCIGEHLQVLQIHHSKETRQGHHYNSHGNLYQNNVAPLKVIQDLFVEIIHYFKQGFWLHCPVITSHCSVFLIYLPNYCHYADIQKRVTPKYANVFSQTC